MHSLPEPLMQIVCWLVLTRYLQIQSYCFPQKSLKNHLKCQLHWKNLKLTPSLIWLQQAQHKYNIFTTQDADELSHIFIHSVTVITSNASVSNY